MDVGKKAVHGEEFLNVILSRLWPYLESYVNTDKVKDEILKATKGYVALTSIKLGNPMTFHEASIPRQAWLVKDKADPLIFDFDTEFKNVEINLSETKLGISFGVVISFKCNLRVELQQLTSEFLPLFEALTIYMTEEPVLNLDFTSAAGVLDIAADKPEQLALSVMKSLLVYPNRLIFPMKDNVDLSRLYFPLPIGILVMQVIKIENLTDTHEFWGMPEFYYQVLSSHFGEFTSKTKTAKNDDGDTNWNETVAVAVCEPDLESLQIKIFEEDTMGDDYVGKVIFSKLSDLIFPSLTNTSTDSTSSDQSTAAVTATAAAENQPKEFESVFDLKGDKTGRAVILFDFYPLRSNVTGYCRKTIPDQVEEGKCEVSTADSLASAKSNGKPENSQYFLKVYVTKITPLPSNEENGAAAKANEELALKNFFFECVENDVGGVHQQPRHNPPKSYSTCKNGTFPAPMATEVFLTKIPVELNFVFATDRNSLKQSAIAQFKVSLSSSVPTESSVKDNGDQVATPTRFEDKMQFEVDVEKVGTLTVLIHTSKLS